MGNLSETIREARGALGLRQTDLAEVLKVKRNTVSQYETGDAAPSTVVLVRLYNLVPPGKLKNALHNHLVRDFQRDYPENSELAEGVIQDIATSESVLAHLPSTKNLRRSEQLARFASLVPRIGQKPMLDASINEILDDWFLFGDSDTVKIFRDAAEYIRVRLDILAGVDSEEASHAELMRESARTARHLAMGLLRQADIAEEKARLVRPKVKRRSPKKATPARPAVSLLEIERRNRKPMSRILLPDEQV